MKNEKVSTNICEMIRQAYMRNCARKYFFLSFFLNGQFIDEVKLNVLYSYNPLCVFISYKPQKISLYSLICNIMGNTDNFDKATMECQIEDWLFGECQS